MNTVNSKFLWGLKKSKILITIKKKVKKKEIPAITVILEGLNGQPNKKWLSNHLKIKVTRRLIILIGA